MARDDAKSLALSDQAIALAHDRLWLYTNLADALTLLGGADEARAIYLEDRGKMANASTPWEDGVKGDFAALRKAGIANPLMAKIQAGFAKPALSERSK
ncbi:MAG: hypothetical protein ABSF67_12615 [Roseiarcus sp.]|jgi:hypothetical protein